MTIRIFISFIVLLRASCSPTKSTDCKSILNKQPYIVRSYAYETHDSAKADRQILRDCGKLDSIDVELLKGAMLSRVLIKHMHDGEVITYKTVLESIEEFKKSTDYTTFRESTIILKTLENKVVNVNEFEKDKQLFIKLGASEKDIKEFKDFIIKNEGVQWTYRQAFEKFAESKNRN